MKVFWKEEVWFFSILSCSIFTFLKKWSFLFYENADFDSFLTFILSEWQEVAPFFCGNQNKTSQRFILALLEASTLTNSMFPIAKTFFKKKFFLRFKFFHRLTWSSSNRILKPRQSIFRHLISLIIFNFKVIVTQIALKLYFDIVINYLTVSCVKKKIS